MIREVTIPWAELSLKHAQYIEKGIESRFSVAEGAIRSGKTIDHCIIAAVYLEQCPDRIHLATGSTIGNAKLNIGVCNGFGLENLFRGRCHWGKYRDNDALFIKTQTGEKIVIFAGGGKSDSYKRILGNSYGLWIATEINEHYDSSDSRTSFVKVAMGRQAAAIEPLTLWDLNPCNPNHAIYSNYIDRYREENLPGYQYQHFTLVDNLSITEQRRNEIMAQYDKNSVWYRRDILGQRCVAEGLIYRQFANNPEKFYIEKKNLPRNKREELDFYKIQIGVDFGGNSSKHAFTASGISRDWKIYTLRAQSLNAKNTDTEDVINYFTCFCAGIEADYGQIDAVYCDSAEQTIINAFKKRTKYAIFNSIKHPIIDRIRATNLMMAANRFYMVRGECDDLADGLQNAVWDETKVGEDVRLDNGTSNIDILDSFEYSWEYYIGCFAE